MDKTEQIIKIYRNNIEKRKKACLDKINELILDNRIDEANLEKVKANIYDVFNTMINASYKKVSSKNSMDENSLYEKFNTEYLKTFERIPSSWRERLENAKKYNDIDTEVVEKTKLEVVDELRINFLELMEGK